MIPWGHGPLGRLTARTCNRCSGPDGLLRASSERRSPFTLAPRVSGVNAPQGVTWGAAARSEDHVGLYHERSSETPAGVDDHVVPAWIVIFPMVLWYCRPSRLIPAGRRNLIRMPGLRSSEGEQRSAPVAPWAGGAGLASHERPPRSRGAGSMPRGSAPHGCAGFGASGVSHGESIAPLPAGLGHLPLQVLPEAGTRGADDGMSCMGADDGRVAG